MQWIFILDNEAQQNSQRAVTQLRRDQLKETKGKEENKRTKDQIGPRDLDGASVDTEPPTWQLHACE